MRNKLTKVFLRMRTGGTEYGQLLWDYKVLFIAGVVLFGPSAFLPLIPLTPIATADCNATMLCTHGTTPWGAATSIFLYDSWTNILAFLVILVAYIAFSDRVDHEERRGRAHFASVAIFVPTLVANLLWVHFLPSTYSWGPSGVVYALWGVLLAFTLFDGLPNHPRGIDPRTWYKDRKERGSAVGALALFGVTAFVLVSNPSQFLSAGPGVNVSAHGISFMGGYLAAHVHRFTTSQRNSG